MMKYTCLLLIVFGLYACQKSGITNAPNNIVDLSFDSLKSISVNIPNDDYNDLTFINENTGLAVSRFGKIIKTTDGGNNWSQVNVPAIPGMQLQKIQFANNQTGYVVGNIYPPGTTNSFGILLKTTDAGQNWNQVTTPASQLYGMHFFDTQNGFLSGYRLYRTADGGQTWTTGTPIKVNNINFKNSNEGILTAQNGVYYKTMNGGATWDSITTTYTDILYNIYFTNNKTFVTRLGYPSLIDINNPGLISPKPLQAEKLFFLDPDKCIGIGKRPNGGGWITTGEIYLTNDCWITSDRKIFEESEKFTAIGKINDHKLMILGLRGATTLVLTYQY